MYGVTEEKIDTGLGQGKMETVLHFPERVVRKPFERERMITKFDGETRTDQSQKEMVDVNNIIRKFDRTGVLPSVNEGVGQYGDVSGLNANLQEIVDKYGDVSKAAQEFFDNYEPKKPEEETVAKPSEAKPNEVKTTETKTE